MNASENNPKLLIIDLESTCFERGTEPPAFFSEIIEIGAVLFDSTGLEEVWNHSWILKPVLFPTLSDFCKTLTTLSQKEVEAGTSFAQALEELKEKIKEESYIFCSWGGYDKNQFLRQCKKFNLNYPFGPQHINLKEEFSKFFKVKPCGMGSALKRIRLPLQGTHHRGLDDAKNISQIVKFMLQKGWKFKV